MREPPLRIRSLLLLLPLLVAWLGCNRCMLERDARNDFLETCEAETEDDQECERIVEERFHHCFFKTVHFAKKGSSGGDWLSQEKFDLCMNHPEEWEAIQERKRREAKERARNQRGLP